MFKDIKIMSAIFTCESSYVRLSVRLSVCHTDGSVKSDAR